MPANPILTVGQVVKSAGDSVRIPMDMGDIQAFIDLLTDSNGNFDPTATAIDTFDITTSGAGAPTVTDKQKDSEYQISGVVSGGTAGSYSIVYSVVLTNGIEISRTGAITIK